MQPIRTHYDNLKVARNAPIEVIRAAYKSLSQKYHPDRNPGNADAVRIMAVLNGSYETLANPIKRKEHDEWIARAEWAARISPEPTAKAAPMYSPEPEQAPQRSLFPRMLSAIWSIGLVRVAVFWLVIIGGINLLSDSKETPPPSPKPYVADVPEPTPTSAVTPVSETPAYVREPTAPNGAPWPTTAAYVAHYKRLNTSGLSRVTIDNRQNTSDVFVKLVCLEDNTSYPVRVFYIPAGGQFTVNKVKAGNYDVRYRDLNSGELARTEAITLEETVMGNRTQYREYTMTLYKVQNGNMQTYGLAESDF